MKKFVRYGFVLTSLFLTQTLYAQGIGTWAEDDYLTDVSQCLTIFQEKWDYPVVSPIEPFLYETSRIWWADFSRLPKEIAGMQGLPAQTSYGIQFYPLRLTRFEDRGEVSVSHAWLDAELLRLTPSTKVASALDYETVLRDWALLNVFTATTYDELLKAGYEHIAPRRLVLYVWLADINEKKTYEWNVAAEYSLVSALSLNGGGEGFAYSEAGLCVDTNLVVREISELEGGLISVAWCSQTNGFYEVYFTEDLVAQAWRPAAIHIPSQGEETQWIDAGGFGRVHPATISNRFYRVALIIDTDEDGLTDGYEQLVTNTDPSIADSNANEIPDGQEDFDGDGVLNFEEYSLLTSPYLADSDGDGMSDGSNGGATFLEDGIDNDGDGQVDEPDEEMIVAGPDRFLDVLIAGKIRGDNQVGQANQQLLLPFVVYLTDTNGVAVTNGTVVTFSATSPSGGDATSLLSNTSDATGNNGFAGQEQTFLTLGSETGIYKVFASWNGLTNEFHAEAVTTLSLEFTDEQYQPGTLGSDATVGDVAHVRVTVSGSTGVTRMVGLKMTSASNPTGITMAAQETAPGSGVFTGSAATTELQPDAAGLGPTSSNPNPGGGNAADDGVTEYSSADNGEAQDSNWTDSDEFDDQLGVSFGFTGRGKGRSPAPLPQGAVQLTKNFMVAAGIQPVAIILGTNTTTSWVNNQADFFYFSGHGLHDKNELILPQGSFKPTDVAGNKWKKDLEIVIIAGCSVLDVTNDKHPGPGKPGKAWAKTGPTYFLGYEGSAPGDSGGAPQTIIERWALEWEGASFGNPIDAWKTANFASSAWNASAIDCSVNPKVAWHFEGTFIHTWESVAESEW